MEFELTLKRSSSLVSAGMALFSWLFRLGKESIVVLNDERNGIRTVRKEPGEIISLEFDYASVEEKFYKWSFSKEEWWFLTAEETDIFLESCHAGYFYLNRQNYNIGKNRELINQLYNELFGKKIRRSSGSLITR